MDRVPFSVLKQMKIEATSLFDVLNLNFPGVSQSDLSLVSGWGFMFLPCGPHLAISALMGHVFKQAHWRFRTQNEFGWWRVHTQIGREQAYYKDSLQLWQLRENHHTAMGFCEG